MDPKEDDGNARPGDPNSFITLRIRSMGEGYVFTSICLSTGRGVGGGMSRGSGVSGSVCSGGGVSKGDLPFFTKNFSENTAKARSVCILLECILVFMQFSAKKKLTK